VHSAVNRTRLPAVPLAETAGRASKLASVPASETPCGGTRAARGRARRAAVAAAVAALALAAGGCAKFDAALGQQEAVIQFKQGTPDATRLKVRAACSHIAGLKPEPLPTDHIASDQLNNVRYQVGNASDAQQARLQQCVSRFPSVAGIEFSSPND
jgi:hypothetical protein